LAKITLKELTETRNLYDQVINDLKVRFKDNLIYQETTSTGATRRPLFYVASQKQLDDVKSTIHRLQQLANEIRTLAGSDVRLNMPILEEGVLLYRIWLNTAHASSSSSTTTRVEIIERIKRRIESVERYGDSPTHTALMEQLQKELRFFENETEVSYRSRSMGHPVTTVGISKIHGIDGKQLLNDAGMYIVGTDFEVPRGETPDSKNKKQRKKRVNIFDELTPVEYSGSTALLYRESEVEARKQAIGFTAEKQKQVVAENRTSKKKRD
jgi:hypothetical protein